MGKVNGKLRLNCSSYTQQFVEAGEGSGGEVPPNSLRCANGILERGWEVSFTNTTAAAAAAALPQLAKCHLPCGMLPSSEFAHRIKVGRDSSVDIATTLRAGWPGD